MIKRLELFIVRRCY